MLNAYTVKIDGDLSRADAAVLTMLCRNKEVIEFGVGASSLIISQVAKSLKCYDTDQNWIDKVNGKLKLIENKTCEPELKLIEKKPEAAKGLGEPCDILFDDGWSLLRFPFLLEFWSYLREKAILHDSRMSYAGNVVKQFLDLFTIKNEPSKFNPGNPDNPYTGSLESIQWNWLESNMVIMQKRNCTLTYENWKLSEI